MLKKVQSRGGYQLPTTLIRLVRPVPRVLLLLVLGGRRLWHSLQFGFGFVNLRGILLLLLRRAPVILLMYYLVVDVAVALAPLVLRVLILLLLMLLKLSRRLMFIQLALLWPRISLLHQATK